MLLFTCTTKNVTSVGKDYFPCYPRGIKNFTRLIIIYIWQKVHKKMIALDYPLVLKNSTFIPDIRKSKECNKISSFVDNIRNPCCVNKLYDPRKWNLLSLAFCYSQFPIGYGLSSLRVNYFLSSCILWQLKMVLVRFECDK